MVPAAGTGGTNGIRPILGLPSGVIRIKSCKLARASDVRKLHLEVEQRNDAARRLYVQEGFDANGRELLSKTLG